MNPFYIQIIELPSKAQRSSKALVLYLLRPEVSENSLDGALSQILSAGQQFDAIHFVGFNDCISQAKTWMNPNSSIRGRLELATVNLEENTRIFSFDELNGEHTSESLDGSPSPAATSEIDVAKRYTLIELFITNNGHMKAPQGFHYVKPSGKHVDTFLRTANVLECSSAANIIAFWIMPHVWNRNIEQIVVDTSGISDIALTVAYEAICRGGIRKLPVISSHQSYGGLGQLKINHPNETLLLISATTSGDLRNELVAQGANNNQVVTLFYLGEDYQKAGHLLCDLTKGSQEDNWGLAPFNNFSAEACPLCKQKSYPVSLGGDQFAFEPPKVEEIQIAFADLPEPRQKLFDQLAGIEFFKVYRNVNDRSMEICLDVNALFSKPRTEYRPTLDLLEHLVQRWAGLVLRGAPVNLKRIIYSNYPLSRELAESAAKDVKSHQVGLTDIVLSSRDLRMLSSPIYGAAALVVTSCIDDCYELMAIELPSVFRLPRGGVYATSFSFC